MADVVSECHELLSFPNVKRDIIERRLAKLELLGYNGCRDLGDYTVGGLNVLGRGHSSVVFAAEFRGLDLAAVKVLRTDSKRDSLINECSLMKRAYPIAPKVHFCDDEFIVMELIRGVRLGELVNRVTRCEDLMLLCVRVLAASRYLDVKGVTHKELNTLKKHVIIDELQRIRIVDFESGFTGFSCNVCRVFSSLIMRNHHIWGCCDLRQSSMETLLKLLRTYKENNSANAFVDLIRALSAICQHNSCKCVD